MKNKHKHKRNGHIDTLQRVVNDRNFMARNALEKALEYVRKLGFSPQLEISIPATKRQSILLRDIYLRPLDGSDKLTCSCCANLYEARKDQFRGTLPNPVNFCFACRESLREIPFTVLFAAKANSRRGKIKLIRASEVQVRAWVEENQAKKSTTHSVK